MLKANESAGNPGIFRVSNTGYAFHVSPTSRKLRDGRIVSHTSIFNVKVSLPAQKGRTVYRALQDILTVVSQSSGYKVGLGVVPTNALSTSTFDEPASEQTAEELLVRVFDATQLGISWRLLYAPDLRMFAMNIHVVRNRPDQ
jgi:hypothetical protein